ncbi:MAG: ornithine cyclodeaminase family protein, partial [bacterium]
MSNQSFRILSRGDVQKSLSMSQAVELMKDAFVQLSTGQAIVPVRMNMEVPQDRGRALFMPVYLAKNKQIGVKIVSIMDDNPKKGLPLIHATVLVTDSKNGCPLALMDGEYLTALRTGAASGLATDLLAREDSDTVAIFGAGVQGRTQLEAVCAVRAIKQAFIFDIVPQKATEFAQEMSGRLSIQIDIADASKQLCHADVICTATTSTTPVFTHDDLKPGVHINGIGAYRPDMC